MTKRNLQRSNRGLAKLNRLHWDNVIKCPSASAFALSDRGCAVRMSLLLDVAKFMDVMISEMDFITNKIGVDTRSGFLVRTWAYIADKMGVPEWRVKQCKIFAESREWVTSDQPKEYENGEWVCLASIKRVTQKYFDDLGLTKAKEEAKNAAITKIVDKSKSMSLPVGYLLTPISMLRKIKKTLTVSWEAYFKDYKNRKRCADIPY
ncbi:hypothetical protein [Vibrio panuliri]|uniref:Replication protein n=1 Tax=Vibrio panuliri TaxID=1381081 RepID=A0ABX3FFG6_9VIBR|nr:hypothetical protein [Vibrio panuliri]KAB1457395.1 hypothetical protein F7O85_06540 [Vibrio panuliri]OLQ91443.1 hypothetical protein BIY20_01140 [Vibrio panuliri]